MHQATGSDDLIAKVVAELEAPTQNLTNVPSTSGRREGSLSMTQGMLSAHDTDLCSLCTTVCSISFHETVMAGHLQRAVVASKAFVWWSCKFQAMAHNRMILLKKVPEIWTVLASM